jgi:hypothetical protein
VAETPLRAVAKEERAANGPFGEGKATAGFRKCGSGTGLSRRPSLAPLPLASQQKG